MLEFLLFETFFNPLIETETLHFATQTIPNQQPRQSIIKTIERQERFPLQSLSCLYQLVWAHIVLHTLTETEPLCFPNMAPLGSSKFERSWSPVYSNDEDDSESIAFITSRHNIWSLNELAIRAKQAIPWTLHFILIFTYVVLASRFMLKENQSCFDGGSISL